MCCYSSALVDFGYKTCIGGHDKDLFLLLLSVSLLDAFFYYVKDYGTLCDKDLFLLPFVKMSYYSKYFELLL